MNVLGRRTSDKRGRRFPIARNIRDACTGRRRTCRCCISRGPHLQCAPTPGGGDIRRVRSTLWSPPVPVRRSCLADAGPCRSTNEIERARVRSASRKRHACRGARGRLITASERKRNFKSAARRRSAPHRSPPACTRAGLTLLAVPVAAAAAAVGGGVGAGVQREAGLPMRRSRVGRKCPQNFHFLAKAGVGADTEEKRRERYYRKKNPNDNNGVHIPRARPSRTWRIL